MDGINGGWNEWMSEWQIAGWKEGAQGWTGGGLNTGEDYGCELRSG